MKGYEEFQKHSNLTVIIDGQKNSIGLFKLSKMFALQSEIVFVANRLNCAIMWIEKTNVEMLMMRQTSA